MGAVVLTAFWLVATSGALLDSDTATKLPLRPGDECVDARPKDQCCSVRVSIGLAEEIVYDCVLWDVFHWPPPQIPPGRLAA